MVRSETCGFSHGRLPGTRFAAGLAYSAELALPAALLLPVRSITRGQQLCQWCWKDTVHQTNHDPI